MITILHIFLNTNLHKYQTTVDVRLILSPDDQQSRCDEVHEEDELQDDRSEDQREGEPFIGNSNQG